MGKHSEVFVAFDVAKKKHAVAIAEGGRVGEVRFLGEVENSPLPIERTIRRLAARYDRCMSASKPGLRDTHSIAKCRRSGMTAWWSLRR
jgi:transposase